MSNLIVKNKRIVSTYFLFLSYFNRLNVSENFVFHNIRKHFNFSFFITHSELYFFYNYYFIIFKKIENFYRTLLTACLLNKLLFLRYKFFLKIGLSFRKKFSYYKNEFFLYMGIRH